MARFDVERILIQRHHTRRRNPGSAEWCVTSGRLVIAYDHPDHDGDATTARIVTLWRRS